MLVVYCVLLCAVVKQTAAHTGTRPHRLKPKHGNNS